MQSRDFSFWSPMAFFEKADAPVGQRRRIAGVISTELRDKQGEILIQKGLDFGPFLKEGWYNDNHSKKTTDVLGYPTDVKRFQKGEHLPDGSRATSNGTWAEGYLLETPEADKVWNLARALAKAGGARRLGYSVEGKVEERGGPDGRTVVKAVVRNVAVTNCPVGQDTRMEALAKSMSEVEKGLTATPAPTPPGTSVAEAGSVTGEGAGAVLMPKHVEGDDEDGLLKDPQPLSKSVAVGTIQSRLNCDRITAERVYSAFLHLEQHALL